MRLTFEVEQEDDGRWLAEVPEIAGVMAYGSTRLDAMMNAITIAQRVLGGELQISELDLQI